MIFHHSYNNHRKFVELIFRNNRGKYPNLDPAVQIEVGDYGYVGKDTGMFMKQGNIFEEGIVVGLERKTSARIGQFIMLAEHVKNLGIEAETGL